MKAWEEYRDKKAHEYGMGSPDSCHRVDYAAGFNEAISYALKKFQPVLDALEKVKELKEMAVTKSIQGNTAQARYGNKVDNPTLREAKILVRVHDAALRALAEFKKEMD